MKLNFCTLFNTNYLARGLVMYDSLKKHCTDFHIYIFAFDDECFQFLKLLNLENLTPISLAEFEDDELISIKPTRTATEYCWTCTSSTILFAIQKFNLSNCTYIDADLLFYSNPLILINEMGNKSVLITEHRYSPEHDQSSTSGKYCVQFVTFKNDTGGLNVLRWWRNACIDWCFNRLENGKFGDQKYLDDWTIRFNSVHELQNLGGGIAPWNVQQYNFIEEKGKLKGTEIRKNNYFDVIFFHFHGVKFYENNIVSYTGAGYTLSKEVKKYFYSNYIFLLLKKQHEIELITKKLNSNGSIGISPLKDWSTVTMIYFYLVDFKKSVKNIFGKNLKHRRSHHYFFDTNSFK